MQTSLNHLPRITRRTMTASSGQCARTRAKAHTRSVAGGSIAVIRNLAARSPHPYLNSAAATTNNGTVTPLQDQTNARGLLVRFKIFVADGGPVPNNATIQSATLSLYKSAGGATTYDAKRVLKSWIETQATWNKATSALNWTTAGATGAGTDIAATADGSASTTAAVGWLAFTVTSGVAAMSTGTVNNGWRLVPTAGATAAKSFHSREYTTNTTLRPKLAITYTVPNVPPTVSLTAPLNGATATAPATIALTATATDNDGTITKVEFYRGITLVATDTTSPYAASDTNVAAGTYSYTAKAYDNAGGITTSTAASVTVNAAANVPPTVTLTAPLNGATATAPATISLAATAADSDGTITKVEFYRGATLIATATASPFTGTDTNVAAGSYSYTAKAYDNAGGITTSAAAGVTVNAAVAAVYYIHPDHLGTPRAITRSSDNQVVWKWDNTDPFGANAPNENPSGQGTFTCNLRFPGQYYDQETGTIYNYFRDYDPSIGRYIESDPIGLTGGISTYAYVSGNPFSYTDPFGLVEIPNPNNIVPGGPWEPNPGNGLGNFRGPKNPGPGGRAQCQYVPDKNNGGPPKANEPYWKTNQPGQKGWQRFDLKGSPIDDELEKARELKIPFPRIPALPLLLCPACPFVLEPNPQTSGIPLA